MLKRIDVFNNWLTRKQCQLLKCSSIKFFVSWRTKGSGVVVIATSHTHCNVKLISINSYHWCANWLSLLLSVPSNVWYKTKSPALKLVPKGDATSQTIIFTGYKCVKSANYVVCFVILKPNISDRWRCAVTNNKSAQNNVQRWVKIYSLFTLQVSLVSWNTRNWVLQFDYKNTIFTFWNDAVKYIGDIYH